MNIKLYSKGWEYKMVLGLPSRDVKLKEIEAEILKAKDLFNQYSLKSANKKEITNCIFTDFDTLEIILISQQRLPVAIRGLKLFTSKVIETILSKRGEDEGNELISRIMRRRSLFKTISIEETYINTKDKETIEVEENEEINNILTNDMVEEKTENSFNIITNTIEVNELCKDVVNLLMSSSFSDEDKKKIEGIRKIMKGGDE